MYSDDRTTGRRSGRPRAWTVLHGRPARRTGHLIQHGNQETAVGQTCRVHRNVGHHRRSRPEAGKSAAGRSREGDDRKHDETRVVFEGFYTPRSAAPDPTVRPRRYDATKVPCTGRTTRRDAGESSSPHRGSRNPDRAPGWWAETRPTGLRLAQLIQAQGRAGGRDQRGRSRPRRHPDGQRHRAGRRGPSTKTSAGNAPGGGDPHGRNYSTRSRPVGPARKFQRLHQLSATRPDPQTTD